MINSLMIPSMLSSNNLNSSDSMMDLLEALVSSSSKKSFKMKLKCLSIKSGVNNSLLDLEMRVLYA